MDIDSGIKEIDIVIKTYGSLYLHKANEAETRRKVIDEIISKVLGWDPINDLKYEERTSNDNAVEFADYIIRTASTGIVIEAKRVGVAFELPNDKKIGKLNGFLSSGNIGDAIKQAKSYTQNLSAAFAVVTNGSAWVIFAANRLDGVDINEGEAIIFRNLQDIKDRFVEFWNLLSRQRVIEGSLDDFFFRTKSDLTANRLVKALSFKNFKQSYNSIYPHIEVEVSKAFSDEVMLNDIVALGKCYIKDADRARFDSRLKVYISDTKPSLERPTLRPRKNKSDSKKIETTIASINTFLPKFFLVLGGVGVGKTTFLHYFRNISLASDISENKIWIYIDCKSLSLDDNVKSFIYSSILEYIEKSGEHEIGNWDKVIKPAYKEKIDALKNGPLAILSKKDADKFDEKVQDLILADYKEKIPYIENIIKYISSRFPVFLVIDNVDQLNSDSLCKSIFIEAQACARKLKSNVIMTLRDSTYLRHKNTSVFDAFQVDTIYIDPPTILPVLSRRFDYVKQLLKNKKASIHGSRGEHFDKVDITALMDVISSSILRASCSQMVEALSGNSIRRSLTLVKEFLSSSNISSDRVLYDFLGGKPSYFPPHEFFKGAVFGQRPYYEEESSLLLNIFDAKIGGDTYQILRLMLLRNIVEGSCHKEDGHIVFSDLLNDIALMGYSSEIVKKIFITLIDNSFISTRDGQLLHDRSVLIPTRLGIYAIYKLTENFTYLDSCAMDAFIHNDEVWRDMLEKSQSIIPEVGLQRLRYRFERINIYLEYLSSLERIWINNLMRYKTTSFSTEEFISKIIIPNIKQIFENEIIPSAKRSFEAKLESNKTNL